MQRLCFSNRGVAKFGIALGSGPRGRGFKSRHSDHVAADDISFAATFLSKSHFSLILSQLLSKSNPLTLDFDLVFLFENLKSYHYTHTMRRILLAQHF